MIGRSTTVPERDFRVEAGSLADNPDVVVSLPRLVPTAPPAGL
ncbi:hypothetical protein [Saccharomonospora viridis]|jgi:hypothetical protein|nr:hypothetical protein [Saccharomonospora viridis]